MKEVTEDKNFAYYHIANKEENQVLDRDDQLPLNIWLVFLLLSLA